MTQHVKLLVNMTSLNFVGTLFTNPNCALPEDVNAWPSTHYHLKAQNKTGLFHQSYINWARPNGLIYIFFYQVLVEVSLSPP